MTRVTDLKNFTFSYKKFPNAVPMIPIRFIDNKDITTPVFDAVFDSGADELTIPKSLADHLGYNLTQKQNQINTANGVCNAYTSKAHFFIGRGGREVEYIDEKICVMEHCPAILVGIKPVFEDYLVEIMAGKKKFNLKIPQ